MSLQGPIQDALRHHAARGRDQERIGPFLATLTRDTDNPYLNYAIPDDDAAPSSLDVDRLVALYRARSRKPRLEYIPSVAPAVEAVLVQAGFAPESRTPLMIAEMPRYDVPVGIELVAPSSDDEFRGAASVQWGAYGEGGPLPQRVVDGLRRTAESGGIVLLARDADSRQPAGAGLCVAPYEGVTELTSIGVDKSFRRRGIAAAMAGWLAARALEREMTLVFLMARGAPEARIYARAGFAECGEVLHISLTNASRNRS
jgi:ribosomal protein S18 acetylase RimI-like enzyme